MLNTSSPEDWQSETLSREFLSCFIIIIIIIIIIVLYLKYIIILLWVFVLRAL